MATSEELAKWIVENQDKTGTPDFETIAEAYKQSRQNNSSPPSAPAPTAPRFMEQRAQNTEAQRQEYAQAEGERLRQERYARGEYGQRFITPEERRARAGAPAPLTGDQAFRENVGAAVGGVSGLVSGAAGLPADLATLGGNIVTLGGMGNPLENYTSAGIQKSINEQLPEYLTGTRSFDPMSEFGQVFAPGTAVAKTIDIAAPVVSRVASDLYRGKGRRIAEGLRRQTLGDIASRESEISSRSTEVAKREARRTRTAEVLRSQETFESQPTLYSTRTPTEAGTELQQAASGNVANMERARSEADTALRQTRNEIVRENEANGVFIDQTPAYREIIQRTQPYVNERIYGPGLRPTVVPEIRNLYTRLDDAIRTRRVELTPDEALAARNAGARDVEQSGENFYRTFRSSFDAVDQLRRYYGQAFAQNLEGFKAIPNNVKEDFYRLIDNVQTQYAGRAQPELQTSWRNYTQQLDDIDTRLGRRLWSEDNLAADIYKEIDKGSENINRLITQTGNAEPVQRAALDFFLNKLQTGGLNEAEKILQPGSVLFETLNNPNLTNVKSTVLEAIDQLRTTSQRATTSGRIAKTLENKKSALPGIAKESEELGQLQMEVENLPIDRLLGKVEEYYKNYYPGKSDEYAKIIRDVESAGSAIQKRRVIRNWFLGGIAGAAGLSGVTAVTNAFLGD